ncbi:MAG: glutaminyl-peptide cyclotransferase [Actinomycetota bacterium]|nr:glutaminyl-peptide cyclotransferase [Actinomycetota bacterium]
MRTETARGLLAGVALWAGLTACSTAADRSPEASTPWTSDDAVFAEPRIPGRPLALLWDAKRDRHLLSRLDPETMRGTRRVPLGPQGSATSAASPGGNRLVFSSGRRHVLVVDPVRMRLLRKVELPPRFFVTDLAWVEDRVVIATMIRRQATRFVRIDPANGEVLGVRRLAGDAFRYAHAPEGIVVLASKETAPTPEAPGPTTIAALHSSGDLRSAVLEEIPSGYFVPEGARIGDRVEPALAVRGSTATVVGVDGTIANVDLTDFEVTVEGRDDSFFAALGRWMTPPAEAKIVNATSLHAQWASPDALVVSGHRMTATETEGGHLDYDSAPAGVTVFDPRDWSTRMLDDEGSIATPAGDLVLVSREYVPGEERGESIGLRAYDESGRLAWQVLEGDAVSQPVVDGGYAFVTYGWNEVRLRAVDLDTGKVVGSRPIPITILPL